jgi:hypothetical protein
LKACNYVQSITRIAARQTRVRDAKLRIFPNSAYLRVCGYPHTRKNWLFTWTELGARQVGIVQSLLVTCRLHDINPYDAIVSAMRDTGDTNDWIAIELGCPKRNKDVPGASRGGDASTDKQMLKHLLLAGGGRSRS